MRELHNRTRYILYRYSPYRRKVIKTKPLFYDEAHQWSIRQLQVGLLHWKSYLKVKIYPRSIKGLVDNLNRASKLSPGYRYRGRPFYWFRKA
jgi:hypothetical protein